MVKQNIKEKIKGMQDTAKELLKIPEWGVSVEVRSMTGRDRARMFDLFLDDKGQLKKADSYPFIVVASTYDPETGERLFGEDDMAWIMEKNANALDRIITVSFKLSGLEGKKSVEAAEKN